MVSACVICVFSDGWYTSEKIKHVNRKFNCSHGR
uniref:Uncharacterized protein n=1 Tax=Anguilla anguilla TaxID=7936 RepID=A0A0E9WN11_ANGAN